MIELSAFDLACVRGGREVFQKVCFAVHGGQMLAVIGPNGAGKSSLLRLVAGLLEPTQGRITIAGGDAELRIGEQAHYVGHQDALKPTLTVAENLAFWSRVLGGSGEVAAALARVGLGALAHLPALHLSAGQRRRLSLARLLATRVPSGCSTSLGPFWTLPEGRCCGNHAGASCRRRADPRGHPRAPRGRGNARIAIGRPFVRTSRQARASYVTPLAALILRDMRLAVRVGGGAFIGVLFFLMVVTLIPFAVGPDLALLARIGPAILWLGALLANLLGLDRLLATDHEDGSLDLILMARIPLELAVAAKALAHWITIGLPLVVAAPLLGILLNLDPRASGAVALTLLAGTPALTCIGLIGAALTVALRRGGLVLAVLVLPLNIPVLIFGVTASNAAMVGPVPFGTPFAILCALSLMSVVIGPFAAAIALRQGLD